MEYWSCVPTAFPPANEEKRYQYACEDPKNSWLCELKEKLDILNNAKESQDSLDMIIKLKSAITKRKRDLKKAEKRSKGRIPDFIFTAIVQILIYVFWCVCALGYDSFTVIPPQWVIVTLLVTSLLIIPILGLLIWDDFDIGGIVSGTSLLVLAFAGTVVLVFIILFSDGEAAGFLDVVLALLLCAIPYFLIYKIFDWTDWAGAWDIWNVRASDEYFMMSKGMTEEEILKYRHRWRSVRFTVQNLLKLSPSWSLWEGLPEDAERVNVRGEHIEKMMLPKHVYFLQAYLEDAYNPQAGGGTLTQIKKALGIDPSADENEVMKEMGISCPKIDEALYFKNRCYESSIVHVMIENPYSKYIDDLSYFIGLFVGFKGIRMTGTHFSR